MDISAIELTHTNLEFGLSFGNPQAPHILLEYINLACPYCRQWHFLAEETLQQALAAGKVYRIIKLYDKEKPNLQKGNVMHEYVPKKDPRKALQAIHEIFTTQAQWQDLSLAEVAIFAEEKLQLTRQTDRKTSEKISLETQAANIQFVPTLILDQTIFDESIPLNQLQTLLN